jgi:hypothetical protein
MKMANGIEIMTAIMAKGAVKVAKHGVTAASKMKDENNGGRKYESGHERRNNRNQRGE